MKINFVMGEMTNLRYIIPLIIEANDRGISSDVYVFWNVNEKYSAPHKNKDSLIYLSKKYNFTLKDVVREWEDVNNTHLTFFTEGVMHKARGVPSVIKNSPEQIFVCTATMADSMHHFKNYVEFADYISFPNDMHVKEYNLKSDKIVYLGSPKYDRLQDLPEYVSSERKRALLIWPSPDRVSYIDFSQIIHVLKANDFEVYVKSRGEHKGEAPPQFHADGHFKDTTHGDWYPHITMCLINQCDLIIQSDSATVKECVMLGKPVINFRIDGVRSPRFYNYLYDDCDSVIDLPYRDSSNFEAIDRSIKTLSSQDNNKILKDTKEKYLWTYNASKRLLDYFGDRI